MTLKELLRYHEDEVMTGLAILCRQGSEKLDHVSTDFGPNGESGWLRGPRSMAKVNRTLAHVHVDAVTGNPYGLLYGNHFRLPYMSSETLRKLITKRGWTRLSDYRGWLPPLTTCRACPKFLECSLEGRNQRDAEPEPR